MNHSTWAGIWAAMGALASAVVTFLLTRRKYTADAVGSEIENLLRLVKGLREIGEDLKARGDDLKIENSQLLAQSASLHDRVTRLAEECAAERERMVAEFSEERRKLVAEFTAEQMNAAQRGASERGAIRDQLRGLATEFQLMAAKLDALQAAVNRMETSGPPSKEPLENLK